MSEKDEGPPRPTDQSGTQPPVPTADRPARPIPLSPGAAPSAAPAVSAPETVLAANPLSPPEAAPPADPGLRPYEAALSADHASPPAGSGEPAAPAGRQDSAVLGELAGRLGQVEKQLAEFHRRAAHQESVIDRLHEGNQLLLSGLSRTALEPVVTDLIRLYDQLSREVRRLAADGQGAQLTWSFAEDVAQILDRCGIEMFSAEPGEPFDRSRHRPLTVVACADESQHNTVAEVIAAGFTERETGRVRRPVQARFYQRTPRPQ